MENKVIKGDCLELMKQIPNESIDMILCDLPYGTTACKWDIMIPFDKLWLEYNRNENDLVLDNTMGSGTTCLAAKELNRKFIGIVQ